MIDVFGSDRPSSPPGKDTSSRPARIRRRLDAYRTARRQERSERPSPRVVVPSFFTLLNMLCGFLALTQVLAGAYVLACGLILLAGFFDLVDGMMARLTDTDSRFGVELDSLSDIVSFGVAPSFLIYAFALEGFDPLGMLIAALPALCGGVRLARYNLTAESRDKEAFEGLPTPGQAVALVALVLTAQHSSWGPRLALDSLQVVVPVVVVLSALMVSSIRFDAIPTPTVDYVRSNPTKTVAYALAGILIVGLQELGLVIVLTVYLTHGIGRAAFGLVEALATPAPDEYRDAS